MRCAWLQLPLLLFASTTQLISQNVLVPAEAPTGLPQATVITAGPGDRIYVAFSDGGTKRLPPDGGFDLASDNTYPRSRIARVRPEGDVTFWVTRVPMVVVDLKVDVQGSLWAAGFARRSRSAANVGACYGPGYTGTDGTDLALAVAKIAPDGKSMPIFQCVGYGWGGFSSSIVKVQLNFDAAGAIYVSGTCNGGAGFAATAGSAMPTPPSTDVYGHTSFAIKLAPDASAVRYATWLPGEPLIARP